MDWRLVPEDDKMMFRVKEWWQSLHLSWTNNTAMKPVMARQFGGAAVFSIDKVSIGYSKRGG